MGKLPIDQLVPGQRVARPVLTASHAVLMQPGFVLTAALIDRLRHHGVQDVWVEEAPAADEAPLPDEQFAALEARFAHHGSNPLMLELKAVIARQLAQEYQTHAGDR